MRKCSKCGKTKSLEHYYKRTHTNGYSRICKECMAQYQLELIKHVKLKGK